MVQLPYDEYIKTLSGKICAVGVLLFNAAQQLLIVKPTYKPLWSIVGGVIDPLESPLTAASREVLEETGLVVDNLNFLLVDYCNNAQRQIESVQFIFSASVLTEVQIANIVLQADELSDYKFCDLSELDNYLSPYQLERVMAAHQAMQVKTPVYIENKTARC
jgi:ADP-ribose pyrophosphatase YjhB (NUDIX family)